MLVFICLICNKYWTQPRTTFAFKVVLIAWCKIVNVAFLPLCFHSELSFCNKPCLVCVKSWARTSLLYDMHEPLGSDEPSTSKLTTLPKMVLRNESWNIVWFCMCRRWCTLERDRSQLNPIVFTSTNHWKWECKTICFQSRAVLMTNSLKTVYRSAKVAKVNLWVTPTTSVQICCMACLLRLNY